MSTLHDLRAELERKADALEDPGALARPRAVRARVRAVRRRRRTAILAAAAVVLVGGAVTVQSLRQPSGLDAADRVVVGIDVPGRVSVLGFPYEATEVRSLSGDDTLDLESGDDHAVLLVGNDLGGGSATLYSDDQPLARVRGDEHLAVPVPVDADTELSVRLDHTGSGARAGVAVYTATGALAAGTGNGTAVYRDEVAGQPLLAAGFSQPGEGDLRLEVPGALRQMRFVPWCSSGADDLWVNVEIDGTLDSSGTCGGQTRDAGAGSSTSYQSSTAGDHAVRVYLTRGADGPQVTPDAVSFGLGVYRRRPAPERVLGAEVDREVEFQGRTWVLDEVREPPAAVDTSGGDRLLGLVGRGRRVSLTWDGALTPGRSSSMGSADGGAGSMTVGVLLAGDRYDVTVQGGEGRLLVYRPE